MEAGARLPSHFHGRHLQEGRPPGTENRPQWQPGGGDGCLGGRSRARLADPGWARVRGGAGCLGDVGERAGGRPNCVHSTWVRDLSRNLRVSVTRARSIFSSRTRPPGTEDLEAFTRGVLHTSSSPSSLCTLSPLSLWVDSRAVAPSCLFVPCASWTFTFRFTSSKPLQPTANGATRTRGKISATYPPVWCLFVCRPHRLPCQLKYLCLTLRPVVTSATGISQSDTYF